MSWIRVAFVVALAVCYSCAQACAAGAAVRLITLDCGRIDIADMDAFADDGSYKGVARRLVVPCYLIRHPKGNLLWDAGIGDQFVGPAGVTLLPGFVAHVPVTLTSQLKRLGLSTDDVGYIGFSHEHVDHIGNANAFNHAIWLLNRREHEWTMAHDGQNGEPPSLLSGAKTARLQMIEGDLDLFGDGSVSIIQAPGHTPGHQVLLVRPSGQRPILLVGDLWHSRDNYKHDRVPRFNTSRSDTIASFEKIRALARETNSKLLIAHERSDFHPVFGARWLRSPTPLRHSN